LPTLGTIVVALLVGGTIGNWMINQTYNEWEKQTVTEKAYEYAQSVSKPVLDFGCGPNPRGDFNVDIVPRKAKNFIKIQSFQKPRLPFPNKYFGAALCYHVIEHTEDPQHCMHELDRVADRIYIITPNPLFLTTWLHGGHKWIFFQNVYFRNPLHLTYPELNDNPLLYPEGL